MPYSLEELAFYMLEPQEITENHRIYATMTCLFTVVNVSFKKISPMPHIIMTPPTPVCLT